MVQQENMEGGTNLDKIFDGKSGRIQAVAPFEFVWYEE